jgi:protease IV
MSSERDNLLDRRKLKRKLGLWQGGALVLLAILVVASVGKMWGGDQPHIARITLSGMIVDDFAREEMLALLAENENAKGLIVRINSPGGTVAGSEALFDGLRKVSENKPTAAFIGTIGASGGYIAALGTDRIFARKNALTGSIGVIFQSPEFSGFFDMVGISVQEVKSSPLKGGPSFYEPMTDGQRAVIKEMIDDSNAWFVDIVSDRREIERDVATLLADGRVYTGGRALENDLIDEVGGEMQAIEWVQSQEEGDAKLPVVDYQPRRNEGYLEGALSMAGFDRFVKNRLGLDGLLALWQPM